MALADAPGAPSSTVLSGITELAAAGAAMTQAAQSTHVSVGNPFGLTTAHSVDGYALMNAIGAPSSTLSWVTELDAAPQTTTANRSATAAAGSATAAASLQGPSVGTGTFSTTGVLDLVQGNQDRAAAATALTDAVTAASSVVSGLTQLAARVPSQAQRATADMCLADASMPPSSIISGLTDLHNSI